MHSEQSISFSDQLRALADRLTEDSRPQSWSPETLERLGAILEYLAVDAEILKRFGYFNLSQACTKLCDLFQNDEVPRNRSLTHCGQEFTFHAFQAYIICPVCQTRFKTRWEDDPTGVALSASRWLGINPNSVPGWNPECEYRFDNIRPSITSISEDR